jgi:hypothetical protein
MLLKNQKLLRELRFLVVGDDDHVDGARLRLWIAATNRSIVNFPSDIWAWRSMMDCYRQGKTLIRLPELSDNHTSSHLVAKQEELGEGNDKFGFRSFLVHTYKWFFTCRKILRHGTDGFASPPKEACGGFLSPLKTHHPRPGLNPRILGPMASTLTIYT